MLGLCLPRCGGAGDTGADGATGSAVTGSGSGSGGGSAVSVGSSGGSDASSGAGGAATIPSCYQTCAVPSDCGYDGVPTFDADNWTCDGTCHYLGCLSDAECEATPSSMTPKCAPYSKGLALKSCVRICSTASDCDQGIVGLKAVNFECDVGVCAYVGCATDGDCTNGGHCEDTSFGLRICRQSCNAAADCVTAGSPLSDADNWACDRGVCSYLGCSSSAECTDAYKSSDYVCQ